VMVGIIIHDETVETVIENSSDMSTSERPQRSAAARGIAEWAECISAPRRMSKITDIMHTRSIVM